MKVVWIVPGFSSDEHDWCIPALRNLAGEIALRCDLHIVALQYPYRRDVYHAFGATVHSLGGANRGRIHTLPVWRAAAHTIELLRPDVLHTFWAYEPGVIAAGLARRVPTIIHLAGGELIDLPDIRYGLRGKPHTRWLMRWALNRARIVTAGSRYLIGLAEKFAGGREVVFAPLGVPPHPLSPSPEMGENISREGESVILNVGSLEPVKDQALLLRTFKRVSEAVPEARLIIAGQGRLEDELRGWCQRLGLSTSLPAGRGGSHAAIPVGVGARSAFNRDLLSLPKQVDFAGEIPHDQLPDVYRRAALCVQTSRHEAQGIAVLEAAARGVPLVGTAVGAIADLSPDAAVAVPVGDEVSLAQAIISLLRDSARRAQLGRAAQAIVAREYALARTVDRTMMMYEMLTSDE